MSENVCVCVCVCARACTSGLLVCIKDQVHTHTQTHTETDSQHMEENSWEAVRLLTAGGNTASRAVTVHTLYVENSVRQIQPVYCMFSTMYA